MLRWVCCLDTGEQMGYSDKKTPYEALSAALYTQNQKCRDSAAVIQKSKSGLFLYFRHDGKTYAIRNE